MTLARPIQRFTAGNYTRQNDWIAPEEPMELRIEGRSVAIIMRTPGHDIDLATGFLLTEGVIEDAEDIQAIAHIIEPMDRKENTVDTILASGVPAKRQHRADRNLFASSSCGVCGKTTLERVFLQAPAFSNHTTIESELACSLPNRLLESQQIFSLTGGLHAAALFSLTGELLIVREDIGRHNAVDKVIGHCIRHDIPLNELILLVSGRVGFEIAQKALMARIPIIVAIGSPSSLAVDFCTKGKITLFGFVKEDRCNQYSGF